MKIAYSVTGAERKALVTAISHELAAQIKYLGMPTAGYLIGSYHIDKTGTVTGPDNRELVADLCGLHDFTAVSEEYDDYPDIDQHHPGRYADPNVPPTEAMIKHAEAWMEGQPEYEDLNLTGREQAECDSNRSGHLTVEFPLRGFTPEKLDNLIKLVNAKAPLLKAALGIDALPIQQTADTLKFPWFYGEIDADHAQAYTTLITLLCKAALKKKRVTAKVRQIEGSARYAMRCFLISLGFIGDEYKSARKILLSSLEGSSSQKSGQKMEVADDEVAK